MGKIHVLLSTLVLILIAAIAVRVDRNEFDGLMEEVRPIVAAAAALETLGPDLAGFDKRPRPPEVTGLPFVDHSLGGLKVWTVPLADSAALRQPEPQATDPIEPHLWALDKLLEQMNKQVELLYQSRADPIPPPGFSAMQAAASGLAREVAETPWCNRVTGLRAGGVGVLFDGKAFYVLASNAWKIRDCLFRREPLAAADVQPIYSLDVAEREIERLAGHRGVVGDHWGKRYLGLKALWEGQRVQIPVLGVQVVAPRVYFVLGLTALALLLWISHSARVLDDGAGGEDLLFSRALARRPASRLDTLLWMVEIAAILGFYAAGLLAPAIISWLVAETWLRVLLLGLGSALAISAGSKIVPVLFGPKPSARERAQPAGEKKTEPAQ